MVSAVLRCYDRPVMVVVKADATRATDRSGERARLVGAWACLCGVACATPSLPVPVGRAPVGLFEAQPAKSAWTLRANGRTPEWLVQIDPVGSSTVTWVARARRMGEFSQTVCQVPKLKVDWRRDPADTDKQTAFMTTHCNDPIDAGDYLPGPSQVFGQYLAYRMHKASGLPALDTRLVKIRYLDTAIADTPAPVPAVFAEPAWLTAARFGGRLRSGDADSAQLDYRTLDAEASAYLALFQILVGNEDWYVGGLVPLRLYFRSERSWDGLHNVFLIDREGGPSIPLAIDFDVSEIAGITPVVSELVAANSSHLVLITSYDQYPPGPATLRAWIELQLHHWRRQFAVGPRAAAADRLVEKKREFYAIADDPDVSEEARERARAQLDIFFEIFDGTRPRWATATGGAALRTEPGEPPFCQLPAGIPLVVLPNGESGDSVRVRLVQRYRIDEGPLLVLCGVDPTGPAPSGFVDRAQLATSGGAPHWRW